MDLSMYCLSKALHRQFLSLPPLAANKISVHSPGTLPPVQVPMRVACEVPCGRLTHVQCEGPQVSSFGVPMGLFHCRILNFLISSQASQISP